MQFFLSAIFCVITDYKYVDANNNDIIEIFIDYRERCINNV